MQEISIAVGQNGRVVIPASIRQQIGIKQGQHLLLRLEGDKIILEKTTGLLNKLQQRFKEIPCSLSEELIEQRRAEAAKENHDS
jgi:AbrB family looped-hinge helix DNA binding protein